MTSHEGPPPHQDSPVEDAGRRVSTMLEFTAAAGIKALEANPDAILFVDPDGIIALANGQAEMISGWPLDRLIGMPVDDLLPRAVRDLHAARRAGFFTEARPRPMGTGMDLRLLARDGVEVPVDINLAPVVLDQGRYVIAVVRRRAG